MINLFRSCNIAGIRFKLIVLYILNLIDMLMTCIFLSTGFFYELNPVMRQVYSSPISFVIIKIFVTALLILYLLVRINKIKENQLCYTNFMVGLIFTVYAAADIIHMFNLMHLVFV